jgi:hypothetical protein
MKSQLRQALLLVAVLSGLSAIFSSPASAEFHSAAEHTVLDGTQVGSDSLVFNAGKISCSTITYSGTLSAKTSSTASLTPSYSGCNAFGFVGVTIDVNGCQIVLHQNTELTDISCGAKPIEITAPNCTLTIGSQTGLASSTFSTEGTSPKRDIKVKLNLTGLSYTQTGKGEPPCTSKSFSDGVYTAEATLTGTDTSSNQIDLWSEEAAREFHSSAAHTTLDGSQIGSDSLVFNAGKISCSTITYSGTLSSETSSTASLTPSYSGCNAFGFSGVTIDVNSCQIVLHMSTGLTDIACGAKPIEVTAPNCTLTIGSQTGLASSTFSTEGTSPKRDIKVKLNLTGLSYTQTGKGETPCTSKSGSDGSYTAEATLTGTDTSVSQIDLWAEATPPDEAGHGRFHYGAGHTTIGAEIQGSSDIMTFNIGSWKCQSISYAGTATTTATTGITVTPSYGGCAAFGSWNVVTHVNGCQWTFVTSGVELVCPGAPMEITYSSFCVITVPSQSLTGVTYTNTGSGTSRDLDVSVNVTGIKYTQDSKSFPGCTAKSFSDGKWTSSATIKGKNTSGTQVALWYE